MRYELPAQKASARAVKVLDVGCGTGRTAAILADAGYHGEYVGVDVRSRFDPPSRASESFTLQFVEGDALTAEVGEGFDLILSNSALEHICDDARLAERLRGLLAPDGLQVHVVPAPAALFVYLWHGFRQYAPRDIADRFGHASRIFALGGLASFLFHLSWVTVPEILMSLSPRRRFPKLYARMLALSLSLDRALGVAATGYVVLAGPGSGVRPC